MNPLESAARNQEAWKMNEIKEKSLFRTMLPIAAAAIVLAIIVYGSIAWVIAHFVAKFW